MGGERLSHPQPDRADLVRRVSGANGAAARVHQEDTADTRAGVRSCREAAEGVTAQRRSSALTSTLARPLPSMSRGRWAIPAVWVGWRSTPLAAPDPLPPVTTGRFAALKIASALGRCALRGFWASHYRALPTLSFHFGRFTPFTMSHRHSDDSPIKASTRTGRIVPAYAGARMSVKLFVR